MPPLCKSDDAAAHIPIFTFIFTFEKVPLEKKANSNPQNTLKTVWYVTLLF